MKKVILIILVLFFINNILAECSSGQININTASLTELDKLTGIGTVKAQAIIDTRPFASVENLIDVYGIGEATLQKIKDQGLACVEGEKTNVEIKGDELLIKEEKEGDDVEVVLQNINTETNQEYQAPRQTISLSPQNIKSDENIEKVSNTGKYAVYGLVIFCVLLAGLYLIKKLNFKKEEKSEFDDN